MNNHNHTNNTSTRPLHHHINQSMPNGHNINVSMDYKVDNMQANTSGTSDSNQSGNIKRPSPHNQLQSAAGAMPIENINTAQSQVQDDIGELVGRMIRVLAKLKETCHTNNNTHHSMDLERFQKLIEWVDYNESHLARMRYICFI